MGVKGPTAKKFCDRGIPVECGQKIRLEHLTTARNLHSHHFSSPLSNSQEVSAFGDDGDGDTGDVWTVVCDTDVWRRDDTVMFTARWRSWACPCRISAPDGRP